MNSSIPRTSENLVFIFFSASISAPLLKNLLMNVSFLWGFYYWFYFSLSIKWGFCCLIYPGFYWFYSLLGGGVVSIPKYFLILWNKVKYSSFYSFPSVSKSDIFIGRPKIAKNKMEYPIKNLNFDQNVLYLLLLCV